MKRLTIVLLLGSLVLLSPGYRAYAQLQDGGAISLVAASEQAQKTKRHQLLPIGIDRIPEEYREDMPLPFGIGLNYFTSNERYKFNSASVSVGGQPIPPQAMILDSLKVVQYSTTLRADAWVLPFLNLYGTQSWFNGKTTDIRAQLIGVQIPLPQEIRER